MIQYSYITGRCQASPAIHLHRPQAHTAARATIAYRIEPVHVEILEPSSVHVAPVLFIPEHGQCLFLRSPADLVGMVLQYEIRNRFSDHHADPAGRAVIATCIPASTFVKNDIGRRIDQPVPGIFIRYYLFQVPQWNILVHPDDGFGQFQRQDLAMIVVAPVFFLFLTGVG